jgi:hypothetical protein
MVRIRVRVKVRARVSVRFRVREPMYSIVTVDKILLYLGVLLL